MSDQSEDAKPYKVGKGKPPKETQWPKGGKSPNPKGRPKGSKNQKTVYKEALGKKITANLDGEVTDLTKQELAYHQLAQLAASGNLKAIALVLQLDEKFDPADTIPPTKEESAADYATLEEWIWLREKFGVFKKEDDDAV